MLPQIIEILFFKSHLQDKSEWFLWQPLWKTSKHWETPFQAAWAEPKTSEAPGLPTMLCLHFCYVLFRPMFLIFSPGYAINFNLEFLSNDSTKCLDIWYECSIWPNAMKILMIICEKITLLGDACLGLLFPFLTLAML